MVLGSRDSWLISWHWYCSSSGFYQLSCYLWLSICKVKIEITTVPCLTGWRQEVVVRISYLRAIACQTLLIMQARNKILAFFFKGEIYQNTAKTLLSSRVNYLVLHGVLEVHEIVGERQTLKCLPCLGQPTLWDVTEWEKVTPADEMHLPKASHAVFLF